MKTKHDTTAAKIDALRHLTLEEVDARLAELNGERASLQLLRRSLVARKRAEQRTLRRMGGISNG